MKLNTVLAGFAALFLVACQPNETTEPENPPMTKPSEPLTGSSWQVDRIQGDPVVDGSEATVEFFEPGKVAGKASCNRYTGGYERDGETLSFGNLAGTMMACPEPIMGQEQRFHQAMAEVAGWRIDPASDVLHLVNNSGVTLIRASRMAKVDSADD